VWNLLVFLLNSLVFILIGLQLSGIVGRLTGYSGAELMYYGVLVSAVAIAVRFAWIYPATYLPRMVSARLRSRDPAPTEQELFIMSWCGMRGIVSLAAALALPLALEGGAPFPGRDLIIFLTFVVIAATLVLQGLSLGPLIRALRVGADWSQHEEEQHARFALGKAAIAAIGELAAKEGIPHEMAERIRAEFAEKIRIAPPGGHVLTGGGDVAKRLRSAAIRAERQELIRIWRENKISDDVLHHLEEDLDYQESRL
jgi:CPA1 family monovalent cation:H+ antiporter